MCVCVCMFVAEYSSSLPIVSDDQFVKDVHDELTSDRQWVLPGVKVTLQFAWSLTLFTLDQFHMEGGKCW